MESEEYVRARLGYEAYCKSTGGCSAITGEQLPTFYNTPTTVQEAWIAAGTAIFFYFHKSKVL